MKDYYKNNYIKEQIIEKIKDGYYITNFDRKFWYDRDIVLKSCRHNK